MKKILKLGTRMKTIPMDKQPTDLEQTLYDALKAMLEIKHKRIDCVQPKCLVCARENSVIDAANIAIAEFEKK